MYEASWKAHSVNYQWYSYNGAEPVAGATQSVLKIPPISEGNIGSYYCENIQQIRHNYMLELKYVRELFLAANNTFVCMLDMYKTINNSIAS